MTKAPIVNCSTCGKDDNLTGKPCPDRKGCWFPGYMSWVEAGAEKEDIGCATCPHWKAVKVGAFCPDCAEKL